MKNLNLKQTTWNLTSLFKNDDDPNIETKRKEVLEKTNKFINKWKKNGKYLTDPKVLKQALDEYENWCEGLGAGWDEVFYFELRFSQDQINPNIKAKLNQAEEFSTKIQNDIQFFTLTLAKVPENIQKKFLTSPELNEYKHFLEKLFAESKYLLSEVEEKILNLKSLPAYSSWVKMTASFISKEERKVLTEDSKYQVKNFSEIISLINSQNKKVRDSAAIGFNEILEKYAEVAEAEVNAILMDKKINDDLRKINRPDLGRHISDDIDSEIVDTLIKAVSDKFKIAQRFYKLKAQLLGVKKLAYHERNIEYGSIDQKYNFEESAILVYQVLSNLDPQFGQILTKFLDNGLIDVFPKKGKRGGAFCAYGLKKHPIYTLLNHTDKLNDVLTFAHELGHGINDELIRDCQNALNFGTPLSTAEVASTFMEDFVLQKLLETADEETKLSLMMMKLNDDVSTIFRQIACYKFETDLHNTFRQKGYLSKEEIGQIFQKNMSSYMGDYVEQSKGSENWWVYWQHIRTYFYVYSYSSGLLISKSLQFSVKKDPQFILKVKQFLSAGLSDSPKNIFKKLNIDITDKNFWDEGLKEVEDLLLETTRLAKKLGKIN